MTPVVTTTQEEEKSLTNSENAANFSCKKCRKVLFTSENLEEHMSQKKGYNTRSHSLKVIYTIECHFFIRKWQKNARLYSYKRWIGSRSSPQSRWAKLLAPNVKKKSANTSCTGRNALAADGSHLGIRYTNQSKQGSLNLFACRVDEIRPLAF